MRRKLGCIALAVVATAACSDDGANTSTPEDSLGPAASVELGEPVEPRIPSAVVPASAEVDKSLPRAKLATYFMPEGVSETAVLDWYAEHMPKGGDFRGLRWLEALPPSGDFGEGFYWCSGPAESLDVAFGQNDPSDGGRAYVIIAIQDVTDGACG